MINSDFTLWAAPLKMGFPSALLKMAMDKHLPLIHPYMVVDQGEAHHLRRYARYPRLGLLVEKESGTDRRDLQHRQRYILPHGAQFENPAWNSADHRATRRRCWRSTSPPARHTRCRCPGACLPQRGDSIPRPPA